MMNSTLIQTIVFCMFFLLVNTSCNRRSVEKTYSKPNLPHSNCLTLMEKVNNMDSAIVFMEHFFVPQITRMPNEYLPLENSASVYIPGFDTVLSQVNNKEFYCPECLIGKPIDVAFQIFCHPTQIEEWKQMNEYFKKKGIKWNILLRCKGFYGSLPSIWIKNGIIIQTI